MKNLIIYCLLLIVNFVSAQSIIEIGGSLRPVVYTIPDFYADEYSIAPALDVSIGEYNTKAILSLGNYSRIGAQILTEWFYTSATYNISFLNTESEAKHGASIEIGFKYDFGSDCNNYRISIGSGVGVLGKFNADYAEVFITPIAISFSTRVNLKPKIIKSNIKLAFN